LRPSSRKFLVFRPDGRVTFNVLVNQAVIIVVADDVFIIIALPDRLAGGAAQNIDLFRGFHFK
jgi:hypothetical protein